MIFLEENPLLKFFQLFSMEEPIGAGTVKFFFSIVKSFKIVFAKLGLVQPQKCGKAKLFSVAVAKTGPPQLEQGQRLTPYNNLPENMNKSYLFAKDNHMKKDKQ